MAECPRCGDEVPKLHPIPREGLAAAPPQGANGSPADTKACRRCIHDLTQ